MSDSIASADVPAFEGESSLIIEAEHPPRGQSAPQPRYILLSFPYVSPSFPSSLAELSPTRHDIPECTRTLLQHEQRNFPLYQTSDDSLPSRPITAMQRFSDLAFPGIQKRTVRSLENIVDLENDRESLHGSDMLFSQEHKNYRSENYPDADSSSSLRGEDMVVSANELQELQSLHFFLTDYSKFVSAGGEVFEDLRSGMFPNCEEERCDLRYYKEEAQANKSERADDDFCEEDLAPWATSQDG